MKATEAVFWMGLVWLLCSCGGNAGRGEPKIESSPTVEVKMLLANPKQGLDGLQSYHMQAIKEFIGEVDGKPEHTKVEISGDEVRDKQTEFVTLRQSFSDGQVETILTGVIGNASYRRTGEEKGTCHLSWNTKTRAAPIVWPVDLVPAITSGEKVGEEEINAVNTVHYLLNDSSLGVDYFDKVSGDLWMAEPAGTVIKFELTLTGGEKTFGKGRSGTQKLTYDLTKINSNDDFIVPEGCLAVLDGVPIMTDAEREYRLPDILRYYTTSSPEKVLEFYNKNLKEQGWQSGSVHVSLQSGQVLLFYKQNTDERLHLSLTPDKDSTLVSVSVGKLSPVELTFDGKELDQAPTATPVTIDPAKAGLPEGVPIYPGADNFTGIPGIKLAFTTKDLVDQVKEFYKTNLGKKNWTQIPGGADMPEAPLMFMKAGTMLIIRATEEGGGSQVEILMVKE